VLLALAEKVSSALVQIIRDRRTVVGELLRSIRRAPAKRVADPNLAVGAPATRSPPGRDPPPGVAIHKLGPSTRVSSR
jgi:hypothetical protein